MTTEFMKHVHDLQILKEKDRDDRARMYTRLMDEIHAWTPRAQRARHHANSMLAIVSKFIPEACREDAYDEFMLSFFWGDFEIVQVPPDRDAKAASDLKAARMMPNPRKIVV